MVQWLKLQASVTEGTDSISGEGVNIPHAMKHSQKYKHLLTNHS